MKSIRIYLFFYIVICSFSSYAQQTTREFIQRTNYLLYLPEDYGKDTTTRWPLVLFLHGSGESGTDIEKVKLHGPPQLAAQGKHFPFIILSPQSDKPTSWNIEMLYKLLQEIKQQYRVNENKVYLTGLSMGGYGTWEMAMKYPETFAAIAPLCGGGDTAMTWRLRYMPTWCFHGAKDEAVLPVYSERLVAAEKRYNPDVHFTLYPDKGHNCWDTTYNNDSLYKWLLAQTRFSYIEKQISKAELMPYTGTYTEGKDTVYMIVDNNGLTVNTRKRPIALHAAGNNIFYIQKGEQTDLHFDNNKQPTGFLLMSDEKKWYRKIK